MVSALELYRYDFKDFIFLQDRKGFGNQAWYVAKNAVFSGGESEITWRVHQDDTSTLRVKGMVDWVNGRTKAMIQICQGYRHCAWVPCGI